MLEIRIDSRGSFINVDSLGKSTLSRSVIKDNIWNREIESLLVRMKKDYAELVMQDITNNLKRGLTYKGGKAAALKKSTYTRKGSRRVFYETGQLLGSVEMKKVGKGYRIQMSKKNHKGNKLFKGKYSKRKGSKSIGIDKIAEYLQTGNSKMRARPFFGLTKSKANLFFQKLTNKYGRQLDYIFKKQLT